MPWHPHGPRGPRNPFDNAPPGGGGPPKPPFHPWFAKSGGNEWRRHRAVLDEVMDPDLAACILASVERGPPEMVAKARVHVTTIAIQVDTLKTMGLTPNIFAPKEDESPVDTPAHRDALGHHLSFDEMRVTMAGLSQGPMEVRCLSLLELLICRQMAQINQHLAPAVNPGEDSK